MTTPSVLTIGGKTWEWVRHGGSPSRAGIGHLVNYRWRSFWFDRHLAIQRRLPAPQTRGSDPVFILGLWRSGTSALHSLLSACPSMTSPTTWQCFNPASIGLVSHPTAKVSKQRPMDSILIDALSPQEDEFALLALGVPSVYRGLLDPRRLPELSLWLDPGAWTDNGPENWLCVLRRFLSLVAGAQPGRLVLKSPSHTFRLHALQTAFPGASYLWIVRDPIETFHSNRKMWTAMFSEYALWDWEADILDRFLVAAFTFAAQSLEEAVECLPKRRLAVIRLSELSTRPAETVEACVRRLQLFDWKECTEPFSRLSVSVSEHRASTYAGHFAPADAQDAINRLSAVQTRALESHGVQVGLE